MCTRTTSSIIGVVPWAILKPQARHRSSRPAAASSGRQRGSAQASPALSTLPLQSDGRSHESVRHQQTSTEELRAPGAWSFSLLASGPPLDSQGNGPESASRGTSHPGEIIPEWWAELSRNGGRHHSGMMGGFARNRHPTRARASRVQLGTVRKMGGLRRVHRTLLHILSIARLQPGLGPGTKKRTVWSARIQDLRLAIVSPSRN
jgi:hypothetical protein